MRAPALAELHDPPLAKVAARLKLVVGIHYRSDFGVLANDIVIWFLIGSHNNYERLIKKLR